MIGQPEIEAAADKLRTPTTPIVRDHLISHALATIGDSCQDSYAVSSQGSGSVFKNLEIG